MAGKKHASSGKKKTGVTVSVTLSGPDKEKARAAINKIKGATVRAWKAKPISGTAKKVATAVKSDLASGRGRRDAKLKATKKRSSLKAAASKSKEQKATRGRIAARRRKQSGAGGG